MHGKKAARWISLCSYFSQFVDQSIIAVTIKLVGKFGDDPRKDFWG